MTKDEIAQIVAEAVKVALEEGAKRPRQEFYTTSELGKLLGKSPATITLRCREGRIKSQKDGNRNWDRYLIPRDEVERLQNGGAYLGT